MRKETDLTYELKEDRDKLRRRVKIIQNATGKGSTIITKELFALNLLPQSADLKQTIRKLNYYLTEDGDLKDTAHAVALSKWISLKHQTLIRSPRDYSSLAIENGRALARYFHGEVLSDEDAELIKLSKHRVAGFYVWYMEPSDDRLTPGLRKSMHRAGLEGLEADTPRDFKFCYQVYLREVDQEDFLIAHMFQWAGNEYAFEGGPHITRKSGYAFTKRGGVTMLLRDMYDRDDFYLGVWETSHSARVDRFAMYGLSANASGNFPRYEGALQFPNLPDYPIWNEESGFVERPKNIDTRFRDPQRKAQIQIEIDEEKLTEFVKRFEWDV